MRIPNLIQNSICYRAAAFVATGALIMVWSVDMATAQQSSTGRPLEYIESSSPLPGGGTITSIKYPGQTQNSIQQLRETAGRQAATTSQGQVARSVLVPSPGAGVGSPQRIAQVPSPYITQPVTVAPAAMATPRVPNLGTPTAWNRAYQPGCANCGTGQPIFTSPSPIGVQPPAAALPPALPVQTQTTLLPAQGAANSNVVQLQNLPPNAWLGRGVVGSPKLYVDGQPVRNLFRFIIP